MRPKTQLLLLLAISAACGPADEAPATSLASEPSSDAPSIAGVWQLVGVQEVASDGAVTEGTPQESLFYFGDEYYFMAYSQHATPSPIFAAPWSPTDQEARDRFANLVVNAGTYELSETEVLLHPDFALYPVVIGSEARIEYQLTEDTLTLTYVDHVDADGVSDPYYASGAQYVVRLRRKA